MPKVDNAHAAKESSLPDKGITANDIAMGDDTTWHLLSGG
jgi:hypothetical protein